MIEQEKVIEHITDCVRIADCQINHNWVFVRTDILKDALALLKEQEARVMTLDELSEKTDVWFESLVYDTIAPALSSGSYGDGTVGLMTLEDELFYMDEADYGMKWRCWTSKPSKEEMEATPWET